MKPLYRKVGILVLTAIAALAPIVVAAQSFNVDLDIFGGPPELGNGAPTSSFGAAANQPGFWNRVNAAWNGSPLSLQGLGGQSTSVVLSASGALGTGIGFNNTTNTGDYALLLNDATELLPDISFRISGLIAGRYSVYLYAVRPQGTLALARVNVPGAIPPNPQDVTGPMPGNAFAQGITHSLHQVDVSNGLLDVLVTSPNPPMHSFVNGFQVVLVPEPISTLTLIIGLGAVALAKRRMR